MFKFLVLCCAVGLASAAPGFLHGGVAHHLPAATSYSSRVDVHSHATPIVTKTLVTAPLAYHAPVISGVSHGYGLEYDGVHGLGYSGLGYGGLDGHGYGGYGYGHELVHIH